MAVDQVNLIKSEYSDGEDGHREYTTTFEVITTLVTDGPITVMSDGSVPARGDFYVWGAETDLWAFCNSRRLTLRSVEQSRKVWRLVCTFSTRPRERCEDSQWDDPLDEPLKISGSFLKRTKPADKDRNGDPILNAVEEPFVPAIEKPDAIDTLVISGNFADIDLLLRKQFINTVNVAPIWGLLARELRMSRWDWSIAYYGQCNAYVPQTFEFEIKDGGWTDEALNQGWRYKVGVNPDGTNKYRTFDSDHDEPLNHPRLLDAAGAPLAAAAAPVFLEFEVETETDYTLLPLPDPLPGPFA